MAPKPANPRKALRFQPADSEELDFEKLGLEQRRPLVRIQPDIKACLEQVEREGSATMQVPDEVIQTFRQARKPTGDRRTAIICMLWVKDSMKGPVPLLSICSPGGHAEKLMLDNEWFTGMVSLLGTQTYSDSTLELLVLASYAPCPVCVPQIRLFLARNPHVHLTIKYMCMQQPAARSLEDTVRGVGHLLDCDDVTLTVMTSHDLERLSRSEWEDNVLQVDSTWFAVTPDGAWNTDEGKRLTSIKDYLYKT